MVKEPTAVELVAVDLDLHGDVDLVRRAEEGEDAVNLEGRSRRWS